MPEVILGELLDIGWVTLGHTIFLPIHYKNYNLLFWVGTSYIVDGFLANKLDHLSTSLPAGMCGQQCQKLCYQFMVLTDGQILLTDGRIHGPRDLYT